MVCGMRMMKALTNRNNMIPLKTIFKWIVNLILILLFIVLYLGYKSQ